MARPKMSAARRAMDLTQADLAARVGCNQSTISHIEAGRVEPKSGLLLKLAAELGITPSDVLDSVPDVPPGPTGDGQTQAGAPDEQPDADDRRLPRTTFATAAA